MVVSASGLAQPVPGGPIRSSVPKTAAPADGTQAALAGAEEIALEEPSPAAPDSVELSAEPAPRALELSVDSARPTARFGDEQAIETEGSARANTCWCQELLRDFDQQVMLEAARWEFTLRLIEERERRDVEEYVARFLIEQRKREFTRRLVEQRLATRGPGVTSP